MSPCKTDVILNTPTGRLLSEVVRAHMHTSLPSSLLGRVLVGLDEFMTECQVTEDRSIVNSLVSQLHTLREELRLRENRLYGTLLGIPVGKER